MSRKLHNGLWLVFDVACLALGFELIQPLPNGLVMILALATFAVSLFALMDMRLADVLADTPMVDDGVPLLRPREVWSSEFEEYGFGCPACGGWVPISYQFCPACGLDTEELQ